MLGSMDVKHFHLTVERVGFHNSDIRAYARPWVGLCGLRVSPSPAIVAGECETRRTCSPNTEGDPAVISPTIPTDIYISATILTDL